MDESKQRPTSFFMKRAIALGLISSGIAVLFTIVFQGILSEDTLNAGIGATSAIITSFSTVYAVVAGFTILIAFDRFKSMSDGVDKEIAIIGDMLDLTLFLEKKLQRTLQKEIRSYAASIANDEWEAMGSGQMHAKTSAALSSLIQTINTIRASEPKDRYVFETLADHLTVLTTQRSSRVSNAGTKLPSLLSFTLFFISLIFVFGVIILPFPNIFVQRLFVVGVAFCASLIQSFIFDIGKPFQRGIWHISKDDFIRLPTTITSLV